MKRLLLLGLAGLAGFAMLHGQGAAPALDPIFQAMQDEIQRARKLSLANLEAPYYVEYVIDEEDNFSISANLGGLLTRRRDRFRSPEAHVRVGDYKFDNSNYVGSGFSFGSRYDLQRFPLEDNYPLLRRYFWLLTDTSYKSAVEAIARKRAALRNMQQSEPLNDFAHAEPVKSLQPLRRLVIDEEQWATRVRQLSAMFADYPDVKNSGVELDASDGGFYFMNSEGTQVREPERAVVLRARATAQASDGMTVRDVVTYHAVDPAHLPGEAEMRRGISALAENVTALAKAPKGEDYSGPVLFEGTAGAQVFAEVLSRNLTLSRRPVAEGGRGGGAQNSELEGRMGARVLPDTFDVVDDPTQKEWRGRTLFGSYTVDREGVVPKPLKLIEKGVLKNYLLTRQPVRGFEGSNGHARLPGNFSNSATIGNLFVSTTDTAPVGELKKRLIELCRTRNKPYGIIVRKMDFPSTASLDEARRMLTGQQGGRPVSAPLLVYRIYVDGHEELVRGMRFRGFNVRSLKDILAAGDDSAAFEYMDNAAPFALVGGTGFTAEVTVVAPSILIDDLELHPTEEELPKLPVVPAPGTTH